MRKGFECFFFFFAHSLFLNFRQASQKLQIPMEAPYRELIVRRLDDILCSNEKVCSFPQKKKMPRCFSHPLLGATPLLGRK